MATLGADLLDKLTTELAKFPGVETTNDRFLALAYAVRDRLLRRWVDSARTILSTKHRTVVYLSAEYLIGPQLGANLLTLDLQAEARAAAAELGTTVDVLVDHEEELPAPRRRAVADAREVGRVLDPQRRARRPVLERSRDRRVRASDLERPAASLI